MFHLRVIPLFSSFPSWIGLIHLRIHPILTFSWIFTGDFHVIHDAYVYPLRIHVSFMYRYLVFNRPNITCMTEILFYVHILSSCWTTEFFKQTFLSNVSTRFILTLHNYFLLVSLRDLVVGKYVHCSNGSLKDEKGRMIFPFFC